MKLELNEIELFEVWADTDDRGNTKRISFRNTVPGAELIAKKAGWWDQNGTVRKVKVYTDGLKIFKVEELGNLPDVDLEKSQVLDSIKSKLTQTEIKELGL